MSIRNKMDTLWYVRAMEYTPYRRIIAVQKQMMKSERYNIEWKKQDITK